MEPTRTQLADWRREGWLRLPVAIPLEQRRDVAAWVDELEGWAMARGPALHHFEQTERGPALARTERFADDHRQLGDFVRGGVIADVLRQLLGEPAVLFKEKVNDKQPGGAGFAPHQDATAYRFVDHHISVMVPLDPGTVASGCLYFAPGHQQGQMETDDRGRVAEALVRTLDWPPVEVVPDGR